MSTTVTTPADIERATEQAAESAGLELFDVMASHQYEQIVLCHEPYTGLRAVICIHNTTLGPALGGIRMWPYENEQAAIIDAMRLARAMTFKAAVAGLNLGGGKTVVIGDSREKNEMLFRALGRFIDTLGGRYIAAEDVGTATGDMEYIAMETPYVTGIDFHHGGSGDPSPMTAYGVFAGIRACTQQVFGDSNLTGKRIAVQGTGHVGTELIQLLAGAGADLTITDINTERAQALAEKVGARLVAPEAIYDAGCEIFTPCALGGVITEETLERLGDVKIVAGAANNQLSTDEMGNILHERGILYAPDYVINAGGLINVSEELGGYNKERAQKRVGRIYDNLTTIFQLAAKSDIPPHKAAETVALQRIQSIRPIADVYTGRARTAWQHRPIALQK